jgi:hypothetical protein
VGVHMLKIGRILAIRRNIPPALSATAEILATN